MPAQRNPADKHSPHRLITAIIEAIAGWTEPGRSRLATMLGGHCWPGGPIDHREPGGVQALRHGVRAARRRRRSHAPAPGGRCPICN